MKQNINNVFLVLGVCAGILMIILGLIIGDVTDSMYHASTSTAFGADFYTEVYQATAKAANNLSTLGGIIANGFRFALISLGLTNICYFGDRLLQRNLKGEKQPSQNEMPEATEVTNIKENESADECIPQ